VVLLSPIFRAWWGVKYCWNKWGSNFSFQNKIIIVLPWGHQADNTTFSKVWIFKILICYTYHGGYETKSICFNNNKITGDEEPITVILNCTLLHNQNDGITVT
jgi:hypothetical protein